MAEWLRELALNAARERPADPTELVLAEVSALRYMLLNLFHATAQANAEGKHLSPDSVVKIRDQANAQEAGRCPQIDRRISFPGGSGRGQAVSRAMRFPNRSGRLFWFLFWFTVGPVVLIFPASAWLYWRLEPLQKVYLTTYAASSVGAGIPHSETTIRWVMKTAPRRKPVPASAEDVVAGPDPKLPVNLSPKAITEGWRGVAYSAPEKVPADSLAKGLRDYVYDGVSVWWLFGRPMLNSLALLMLLYVLRLQMKQGFGRREQEERHGRRIKGPELASALRWRGAKTDGIRFRLRFESALLRWLPFGPSYRVPKRLEASHILMMGDTGSGKSNAIRQLLRQVREREESAIVYDPAMDFVGEFYSPARGDLILNPLGPALPVLGTRR